jgi:hypothetical protein
VRGSVKIDELKNSGEGRNYVCVVGAAMFLNLPEEKKNVLTEFCKLCALCARNRSSFIFLLL